MREVEATKAEPATRSRVEVGSRAEHRTRARQAGVKPSQNMRGSLATSRNTGRRAHPELNVTPLVDVVLVLLIIFMVVTPLAVKQFWLHVPQKSAEKDAEKQGRDDAPTVLTLDADGAIRINKEIIQPEELGEKLPRIFAANGDAVIIFDAADAAPFGEAMRVMDLARAAGAVTIAVTSRELR